MKNPRKDKIMKKLWLTEQEWDKIEYFITNSVGGMLGMTLKRIYDRGDLE